MPTIVPSDYGSMDIDEGQVVGITGGVAIFNPAIKAIVETGNPVILLALDGDGRVLVVDDGGHMLWRFVDGLTVDWRYDFKTERWTDSAGEPMEGGE